MVLEQVLTIIFALGAIAALIVYATRPRPRGASISMGHSAMGSFTAAETVQAAPSPQAAAIETSPPDTHVAEEVSHAAVDTVAPGPVEVATVTAGPIPEAPAPVAETGQAPARKAARAHRARSKGSTTAKTRARSTRKAK